MKSIVKILILPMALIFFLASSLVFIPAPKADAAGGLVAQYKLNSDFKDATGNGNDGVIDGDVSIVDDSVMGKCALFNGGFIKIKSSPGLNLGSNFTISVWVKVDPNMAIPTNKSGPIISKLDDRDVYNNINWYTKGTYGMRADMRTNDGERSIQNKAFTDYKMGEGWSQLVLAGDGQNLYLYHNGSSIETKAIGNNVAITSSSGDMRIGVANDSNNKTMYYKGRMADLRIYNYTLGTGEIKTLFSSGAAVSQPAAPTTPPVVIAPPGSSLIILQIGSPTMQVNGAPTTLGSPAALVNGRTMVPLRAIFEALGASVNWNAAEQSVTATRGGQTVKLTIGSSTAFVNGTQVTLDPPPQIIGGYTMVPLRFVGESMGAQVDWNSNARQITIVTAGQ